MVLPLITGALLGLRIIIPKILPRIISIGKSIIPKTTRGKIIGGIITAPAVLAIASEPKTIFKVQKSVFKKTKKALEIIEDPTKARDVLGIKEGLTFKEKLITGAKVAGVGGLVVAGALGVKSLLEKRKEKKLIKEQEEKQRLAGLKQVGFTEPLPVGLGGIPIAIQPQIQPVGRPGEPLTKMPVSNIIQIQVH